MPEKWSEVTSQIYSEVLFWWVFNHPLVRMLSEKQDSISSARDHTIKQQKREGDRVLPL